MATIEQADSAKVTRCSKFVTSNTFAWRLCLDYFPIKTHPQPTTRNLKPTNHPFKYRLNSS